MKFELKRISPDAVPEALEKVERYRLLNEPVEAQSICEDILSIEPDHQQALVMLLLSITDQFIDGVPTTDAERLLPRLSSEYQRAYYAGIICERMARAMLQRSVPGGKFSAYDGIEQAMHWFERAEALRPPGNDDALLRWNTCARMLMRNPSLEPRLDERMQPIFGE